MQKKFIFSDHFECPTIFLQSDEAVLLAHFCGRECDSNDMDSDPERTLDLLSLETSVMRFGGKDFYLLDCPAGKQFKHSQPALRKCPQI